VKLSAFITTHLDDILREWKDVAVRREPRVEQEALATLYDQLGELLRAVARGLDAPPKDEAAKAELVAHGDARDRIETVGKEHGADRAEQGFPLSLVISEFPLLRSCVARLWLRSTPSLSPEDSEDLVRFNEAIDLALTESVSKFVERVNRSKEMFVGILGHDLRNPLSAIIMSAKLMLELGEEQQNKELAKRIVAIGERTNHMVADLLEFTRSRLGDRIPIARHDVDLEPVIREAADELTRSHPGRSVHIEVAGNLHGSWDDRRLIQALVNLLGNAADHGAADAPISVSAKGENGEIAIAVHNEGEPIPAARLEHIFEPLVQLASRKQDRGDRSPSHLGLGLYIAKEIVAGHDGRIDVESSAERGTTFTIHLPRVPRETDPAREGHRPPATAGAARSSSRSPRRSKHPERP
jgi:signal transduction histidine kinase